MIYAWKFLYVIPIVLHILRTLLADQTRMDKSKIFCLSLYSEYILRAYDWNEFDKIKVRKK